MTALMDNVKAFLAQYGWKYEISSPDILVSGFRGERSKFVLVIKTSDDWLILSVSPYVEAPKPECRAKVFEYLARLNYRASLVKFSNDDAGSIILTVELPSEGVNYNAFVLALEALCFYADDQYPILIKLAHDPNANPPG